MWFERIGPPSETGLPCIFGAGMGFSAVFRIFTLVGKESTVLIMSFTVWFFRIDGGCDAYPLDRLGEA